MGNKGYDLTVNVMMVGGRRCGKTSVLAAMQECFQNVLSDTPLVITPGNTGTLNILVEKANEMKQYFANKGKKKVFIPDDSPTDDAMTYQFAINIKGKDSPICIKFSDYPGEWWKTADEEKSQEITKFLNKSRVLLIAIDTPHLMEEKGIYNENQNYCERISQMIKMEQWADDSQPGLVLFVPLKCERYYNDNKMGEVNQKVQEAYEPLLQYLKQPSANGRPTPITVAITPIRTLGGAAFDRFERDNGDIIINERWGTPKEPLYCFPDMTVDAPEPKRCEQPLVYILAYVLEMARKGKQKKNNPWGKISNWFQKVILDWPTAKDYLDWKEAIQKKLEDDEAGYSIIKLGILRK